MRQLTKKEKRTAARKRAINKIKQNKKVVILICTVLLLLLGGTGFGLYEMLKPETFKDILGKDYTSIKWNYCTSQETVEDIKRYTLERAYPGSIGNTSNAECVFYDENNNIVGSVTFLGNGNYLVYENKVYKYYQNKKE